MLDNLALIGLTIFLSTIFIIVLHAAEWLQIGTLARLRETVSSGKVSSTIVFLQRGLGIEAAYYFLLLIGFVVFFPGDVILMVLVAMLGVLHLTAFQYLLAKKSGQWIRNLTAKRVAGVLVFDVLEVIVLVVLALRFLPIS